MHSVLENMFKWWQYNLQNLAFISWDGPGGPMNTKVGLSQKEVENFYILSHVQLGYVKHNV